MGLPVYVYSTKDPHTGMATDSTAGGTTSRCHWVCVVNADGPFDPSDDMPAMILIPGPTGIPILVNAKQDAFGNWVQALQPEMAGPMYGGNNADCSDSRWGRAVRQMTHATLADRGMLTATFASSFHFDALPIPTCVHVHDRFETWAQYDMLSR